MDLRKLKKLIDLVEQSGIAELEITEGEEKVRISRSTTVPAAPATMNVQTAGSAAVPSGAKGRDPPPGGGAGTRRRGGWSRWPRCRLGGRRPGISRARHPP